jgi:hypothetical protein
LNFPPFATPRAVLPIGQERQDGSIPFQVVFEKVWLFCEPMGIPVETV